MILFSVFGKYQEPDVIRKNCPFWLVASTTKDENNYALAGEESSDRDLCYEPE
jgi:hypothetical protein